ncbi:precorrin isomerase [Rubidibacter lacunae KORDI 51-2]|uniref:Precorrin isomerase n=2 Tax=Rubidibacter TaxID=582491 RepID=U5DL29_9CHRO|nr:precorrin isomerase [Rubidibacter lacunae KORDI 51-2]
MAESFAIIDRELGPHSFAPDAYAIVRRVIHATADFEFSELLHFSPGAIASSIAALRAGVPIVVDVEMLERAVASTVARTFGNPLLSAISRADAAEPGKTRTETGLLRCFAEYPHGLYAIGNAPSALKALCTATITSSERPAAIVGAPVGFVGVVAAKQLLAQTPVPQIRIDGRKGGTPAAAAILNALLVLAYESVRSG